MSGDVICFLCFLMLSIALFALGFSLRICFLIAFTTLLFLVSLILSKSGHVFWASYVTTFGFILSTSAIGFLATPSTELVHYRTACFAIVMATLNSMITLKKSQLIIFHVYSHLILIGSAFTRYSAVLHENPKATVAAIVINVLAIISANMILYSSGRLSKLLIKHAEKEHDQAVGSLMTITSALGQAQESMNIGQQLNTAANSASQSVTEIKELYKGLLSDTENLKNQTVKIKEASQIVSEQ
ncbi:MAG: hypothetical protein K5839_06835, partial [Treponemataceae bacterium]|nr:hypothetical protein [Treponemataceae bacterium]